MKVGDTVRTVIEHYNLPIGTEFKIDALDSCNPRHVWGYNIPGASYEKTCWEKSWLELVATSYQSSNKLKEFNLTTELYREYDFGGRVYRIDNPVKLFYRDGGITHRILDSENVVHCVPVPGEHGCVLRWKNKDSTNPCEF